QTAIIVLDNSDSTVPGQVEVKKVLIANAKFDLDEELQQKLSRLEKEALQAARSKIKQTYVNNPEPLIKLRNSLAKKLQTILNVQQYDDATATIWREFLPISDEPLPDTEEQKKLFEEFRKALAGDDKNGDLETALSAALGEFEQRGIFDKLKAADEVPEGNREEIVVIDKNGNHSTVAVTEVLLPDIKDTLRKNLEKEFKSLGVAGRIFGWLEHRLPSASTLQYQLAGDGHQQKLVDPALAQRAYYYLQDRLPTTLSLNEDLTEKRKDAAAAAVQPQQVADWYHAGDGEHPLAKANKPLDETTLKLLRAEYNARLEKLTPTVIGSRLLAVLGMYLAIFTLCGLFIYFRYPDVITDLHRFSGLLVLAVLAVGLSKLSGTWKTELIPMLLFGMTVAIAYNQELALLMSAVVGLVVVLSLGHGLASFVILMAASATVVLMLRRVRSRVKLVYVGLSAGTVAMLTAIGVNVVENQPLGNELFLDAGLFFLWGVAAGFAMTGLLPFIESVFGVLTEISLLELGDVAHPLLQELVRRAPGTYNQSINVASMAEAAAESIGAKGLLLRVGAYFHDIGKMLKPQYFVENQGEGANQHESLVPAMSTLIIIAHVKDGADLARQHHLPQPIIDFIQQHHGTTLVQYFYERASENSLSDPNASEVDENTYRYPGPKPQTKEAGILMLADAVESASRVLVEPTPSRIENLVEDIAMKRLLDGQLDQCGLTLQEVRIIQDSLIKSLTAVYHGRVKYPSQRTA
ncbi:MAG: HDIG domain-containing protein, partial [Planctomycetales bacterium]